MRGLNETELSVLEESSLPINCAFGYQKGPGVSEEEERAAKLLVGRGCVTLVWCEPCDDRHVLATPTGRLMLVLARTARSDVVR